MFQEQLHHLKEARSWFMDATFKVVRRPFKQLLSIHAYVSKGTAQKSVPLAFALMSAKRETDYEVVLRHLCEKMDNQQAVDWIMLDFEAGKQN